MPLFTPSRFEALNAEAEPSSTSAESTAETKITSTLPLSPSKRSRPQSPIEPVTAGEDTSAQDLPDSASEIQKEQKDSKDDTLEPLSSVGAFRMGAGGSLRVPKKRAKRPLVKDIQWESGKQPATASASAASPDNSCVETAGEPDTSAPATPKKSTSGPSQRSTPSPAESTLNPRAAAFTSPKTSSDSSSTMDHERVVEVPAAAPQEPSGSQSGVAATVEAVGGAASGSGGATAETADKPKKKKKNKKKKKAQGPQNQPEDYDDIWPSLPTGSRSRDWTINDAPAAWPYDSMSMTRNLVAHLLAPGAAAEEANEGEGSGERVAVETSLMYDSLGEDESAAQAGS